MRRCSLSLSNLRLARTFEARLLAFIPYTVVSHSSAELKILPPGTEVRMEVRIRLNPQGEHSSGR